MKTEYSINLPSDIRNELTLIFEALDVTHSGGVDMREAALVLRSFGIPASNEDIKEALLDLDAKSAAPNQRNKSSPGT